MLEHEEKSCYRVLPQSVKQAIQALPRPIRDQMEEIRLRLGCVAAVRGRDFDEPLHTGGGSIIINRDMLDTVLELAADHSVYASDEYLRQGFITLEDGHRIGFCGQVVLSDGNVRTLRDLTSVSIRIARAIPMYERQLRDLFDPSKGSVLLIGPPGAGKTTVLRELTRLLSDVHRQTVSLIDERFEIAACRKIGSTFCVGSRTDILSGCPKAEGMLMMLRTMCPQWLVVDEITRPEDIDAIEQVAYCGVHIAATAHASSSGDLHRRGLYRKLIQGGFFSTAIVIDEYRQLHLEELA